MSARRSKVAPAAAYILDSNLYVRAFRDRDFGDEFRRWHGRMIARLAMSAIVLHEILVGATSRRRAHLVHRRYASEFLRRRRLLVPTEAVWTKAADADRRIRARGGYLQKLQMRSFLNDLLIALTCREIGAILVTANVGDFELVRSVTGVRYVTTLPALDT